jgi:hypothetical protein
VKNQSGQVVLEYVLILIVAASIAALLTKGLVSREGDNPGVIMSKWNEILKMIGQDEP